jgi:DNA-binding response OmpR family regulator
MKRAPVIVVIEDEQQIQRVLRTGLQAHGYEVRAAEAGRSGLALASSSEPDLVILDLGLPDIDGIDVVKALRERSWVPIIVLTARNAESAKVAALDIGADDYLTKPFGNAELVARVHALIRRARAAEPSEDVLIDEASGLRMEVRGRCVSVDGVTVPITPLEWRLLMALVQNKGQVLSSEQLLELAWNDPVGVSSERVKFAILRLRRKLGAAGEHIENVRGFGYRLL